MPNINLSILNQRQTPAFFADTLANRPAPSFVGRIFISTDTLDLYRDTGTAWLLLSPSSTGTITGLGAAGQVTYFSGTSSITGNNNLFWDSVNSHLGIKTTTPDCALDVNHDGTFVAKFNNTAAGSTLIGIFDQDNPQWLIGTENVNDSFKFYDATNFPTLLERVTFKTNGQTFIGTETTSSGRLVVNDATGDNHIVVIGATAPSLRINNSGSGATKQIGIGLATATNNFIQGSVDRDMAIFNGSTTPSPILFGIYDTTNIQEAARISAARNFLIGTTTDGGQKLQVNGGARATGYYLDGMTLSSGALYFGSLENRVTLANYNVGGILRFEVNGGSNALTINSDLSSSFKNNISCSNTNGIITLANGNTANGTKIQSFNAAGNADGYLAFEGFTKEYGRFDASGNLGLGVTPNAWSPTLAKAIQISNLGTSIWSYTTANTSTPYTFIDNNAYYDGTNNIRIVNNRGAARYQQINNIHRFEIATSGTAGDIISFTQAMTLADTGNLLIGTTTDTGQNLQVNGTAKINSDLVLFNNTVASYSPGNISTTFVATGATSLFCSLVYIVYADSVTGLRDFALVSTNFFPAGVVVISSTNNGGNGVTFQMNVSSLEMKTTVGTVQNVQIFQIK
jgi:hypothetical protein